MSRRMILPASRWFGRARSNGERSAAVHVLLRR